MHDRHPTRSASALPAIAAAALATRACSAAADAVPSLTAVEPLSE